MKTNPSWMQILDSFPGEKAMERLTDTLCGVEDFHPFESADIAITECGHANIPFSLLPIGRANQALIAVDVSVAAMEAGEMGVLRQKENEFWAFAGAPERSAHLESLIGFEPGAIRVHQATSRGDSDTEVSLLAQLLRRPIYTASHRESILSILDRVRSLQASRGAESLTHRLAKDGLDAEEWRIVGAERAIAGRTRDALVCLTGAHFLGSSLELLALPAAQTYGNSGWKWGGQVLKFHKRRAKANP